MDIPSGLRYTRTHGFIELAPPQVPADSAADVQEKRRRSVAGIRGTATGCVRSEAASLQHFRLRFGVRLKLKKTIVFFEFSE
jgi:hypothetical protein